MIELRFESFVNNHDARFLIIEKFQLLQNETLPRCLYEGVNINN